jgi:hypothetical protein
VSENVKEREWLRLVIGVVFVVVVIGAFTFLFRDRSEGTSATSPGFSVVAKDSFGRKAGAIDAGKNSATWKSVRGGWSVAAGAAFVSEPAPLLNIAVVDAGPNASVKAVVSGLGHCGLIANLIDEKNFLALVRIEEYGIWNLEQRVDGIQKVLGTVTGSPNVALKASIAVEAPIVTATVGEQHISVSVSGLAPGRSAGLYAVDPNPSDCAFDDVVFSRPK